MISMIMSYTPCCYIELCIVLYRALGSIRLLRMASMLPAIPTTYLQLQLHKLTIVCKLCFVFVLFQHYTNHVIIFDGIVNVISVVHRNIPVR